MYALGLFLLTAVGCSSGDKGSWSGGGTSTVNPPVEGDDTGGGGDDTAVTTTDDTGGDDTGGDEGGGDEGGDDTGTTAVIEGTGYDRGDVAYDLSGTSHTGAAWSLHDHAGSIIVLVVGHLDYATMTATLGGLDEVDESVLKVALIGRDIYGSEADATDAADAAIGYGIDAVLTDPTGTLVNLWSEYNPPKTYVIDQEMTIYWTNFGSTDGGQIQGKVDELD